MTPTQIHDTLWTGDTARELRRHPAEVREMQFYLLTCPDRSPYGLFLLETDAIAQRLGQRHVSWEHALAVLQSLSFCRWDPKSRWVWVIEMARIQFNAPLASSDYRCMAAQKWYRACLRNPFLGPWFDRYERDFHLTAGKNPCERRDHERETEVMTGKPVTVAVANHSIEAPAQAPVDRGSPQPLSTVQDLGFDLSSQEDQEPRSLLTITDPARARLHGAALDEAFEGLWLIYPNPRQKKDAREEFKKLKPTHEFVDRLRASIYAHRQTNEWIKQNGEFVPRFVNFLKQRRWEDDVQRAPAQPSLSNRNLANVTAAQRFIERGDDAGQQKDPA